MQPTIKSAMVWTVPVVRSEVPLGYSSQKKCVIAGTTRCVIGYFWFGTGQIENWAGDRLLPIPMTFLP
jgi:hypothetical protein